MHFPFELIELTHPLSSSAPSWEGDCGFTHEIICDYESCRTPVKFRVQKINMYSGIGTHMDAPAHCIPRGLTIDAIDLNNLIAPCIVIDVSKEAHESYLLPTEAIHVFERKYGKIGVDSFVIIRTGWDAFWDEPEKYRNDLKFPSISQEAATLLIERKIVGLGIDTLSPDISNSDYPVHQAILGAGKYLIENVANSNELPPQGSFSLAMPMRIQGGTEAPTRLIGLVSRMD
jgi:kynurenine formamidase